MSFDTSDVDLVIERIVAFVSEIYHWIQDNDLKLNQGKTDVSLIHSKFRNGVSLDHIILGNENISIAESVVDLGIIFDSNMTFDDQIKHLYKTSFFHLRNFFRIRRYLTGDCALKVIHAFITSRIDYCNHLYYGLPKYQLNKIQRIQNTAARFVTCKGRFEHVTPLLVQLHWLPISYRTVFKLLLLVYKSVNGLCPSYVADLLKIRSSSRSLRSSSMDYLVQPVSKTKTYGERAFSVRAPKLWNSLPFSIRNYKSSSVTIFKKNIDFSIF